MAGAGHDEIFECKEPISCTLKDEHRIGKVPDWADSTRRWSSFNVEDQIFECNGNSFTVPGLRTTDEVDINIRTCKKFNRAYACLDKLGEGHYGVVHLCKHTATSQLFAVKVINLAFIKEPSTYVKELAITRRLKHENIIRLHEAFCDGHLFYLVMEHLAGGDLMLVLRRHPHGVSTTQVKEWSVMMLKAVAYLHHHRLCHRDIKLENFMLKCKGSNCLKLIDFGLSLRFKKGEGMTGMAGTLYSMAPEVLCGTSYHQNVDIWSTGCVIFELSTGHMPHVAPTRQQLSRKILTSNVTYEKSEWARHPHVLLLLVQKMLDRNPKTRRQADSLLLSDRFLTGAGDAYGNRMECVKRCAFFPCLRKSR